MIFHFFNLLLYLLCVFQVGAQSSFIKNDSKVIITVSDSAFLNLENARYKLIFDYIDNSGNDRQLILRNGVNLIEIKSPVFIIQKDFINTPFYIIPGDTLTVHNVPDKGVVFKHLSNKKRTAELNLFSTLFEDTLYGFSNSGKPLENIGQVLLSEKKIFSNLQLAQKFTREYFNKNIVSDNFKESANYYLINLAYQDSLRLLNEYRSFYIKDTLYDIRIARLKETLTKRILDIQCFVNVYSMELFNNTILFHKSNAYLKDTNQARILYSYIEKNYTGESRKILIQRLISLTKALFIELSDEDQIRLNVSPISSDFKLKGFDKFFRSKMEGETTLLEILQKSEEKYFLVDFWASWCRPCREEFPYSYKIQDEFKNKIKFLYFSIDEDPSSWLRSSKKDLLPSKNNFLLIESRYSELKNRLRIDTIPRYIIIDNKLNVLFKHAPRPSNSSLKELLNKLTE